MDGSISDHSWLTQFDDPIDLPGGGSLVTLRDAATYVSKLSKNEQQSDEWRTALGCLIEAAENRGFLVHARIGMMKALNRNVEQEFPIARETH